MFASPWAHGSIPLETYLPVKGLRSRKAKWRKAGHSALMRIHSVRHVCSWANEIVFALTKAYDSQGHTDTNLYVWRVAYSPSWRLVQLTNLSRQRRIRPHEGLRSHKAKQRSEVLTYELMVLGMAILVRRVYSPPKAYISYTTLQGASAPMRFHSARHNRSRKPATKRNARHSAPMHIHGARHDCSCERTGHL